jgi:hypothetical protein
MPEDRDIGKREILNALGQIETVIDDIRQILNSAPDMAPVRWPGNRPRELWDCVPPTKPDSTS